MPEFDLSGATVISVKEGQRLVFVLRRDDVYRDEADHLCGRLREALPGVEVHLIAGVTEVIVHADGTADYPDDEAMAAIAAACTCPGCMTGGKCIDDPERWDSDDEINWREVDTDELDH